jgi:hypothetical protein
MPSDPATSRRGDRREGGGGWAARVRDLVAGGLKVEEEGGIRGIRVEREVGAEGCGEGDEEAGSEDGLKDGRVCWGRGGLEGLGEACRWYGGARWLG